MNESDLILLILVMVRMYPAKIEDSLNNYYLSKRTIMTIKAAASPTLPMEVATSFKTSYEDSIMYP